MDADYHSLFTVEDLLADAADVAEALLQSCRRKPVKCPVAVCQLDNRFLVTHKPAKEPPLDLQFVPLRNPDLPTLQAILHERWKGGYDPVGLVTDRTEAGELLAFLLVQKNLP